MPKAATCQTSLPAPWRHHQLQHKMTEAISTSIYTVGTEVPPAHYIDKDATQRGRGSIIAPAAHQCLRIPPLGPQSSVPHGEQMGCPGQRVAAAERSFQVLLTPCSGGIRAQDTSDRALSYLQVCWATVEAPLSHPLKPATCPGPAPFGEQAQGIRSLPDLRGACGDTGQWQQVLLYSRGCWIPPAGPWIATTNTSSTALLPLQLLTSKTPFRKAVGSNPTQGAQVPESTGRSVQAT